MTESRTAATGSRRSPTTAGACHFAGSRSPRAGEAPEGLPRCPTTSSPSCGSSMATGARSPTPTSTTDDADLQDQRGNTPDGYLLASSAMDAATSAGHAPGRAPAHDPGHEMPTHGPALTGLAISATLHCLTGCAIGEVAGMAIGTAFGFSDVATI